MKGYYYLAQAQLALHHPNEALNSALTAYDTCLKTNNSSASNISALVLQAKKEKWEAAERQRLRGRSLLLEELEDGIQQRAQEDISHLEDRLEHRELDEAEFVEEKTEIETSTRHKVDELRNVFATANPANLRRRVRRI